MSGSTATDPDRALLVAESLVHETTEALETGTGFSAQRRPSIAEYRVGVADREERFAWHVAPAITVAGVRRARRTPPASERICRAKGPWGCPMK